MDAYYLLFDVGGTEIKLNALDSDGRFLYKEHQYAPSYSLESKEAILSHFRKLIFSVIDTFPEKVLKGIGFAFPGPFDYEEGISLMQGMRKYEAIYGVNLRQVIQSWLKERQQPLVPIRFENDATCFALGEYHQNAESQRGIYLTLGTGCGSSFIAEGKVVKGGYGLNDMGMIYDVPFREGIIDEYLSVNGLKHLATVKNYPFINGKELADAALAGHALAQEIYRDFGTMIGEGIQSFVADFQPDEVVFGGQISKSIALYHEEIAAACHPLKMNIRRTKDTTTSTLYGIYYVLKDNQ